MRNFNQYNKFLSIYLEDDFKNFINFKTDKDLSVIEKKLLHARVFTKNKQWKDAKEILESSTINNSFLLAEKYFLLGQIHLNTSMYEDSAVYAQKAIQLYKELEHKKGVFKSTYNLSVSYNRLGLDKLSFLELENSMLYTSSIDQEMLIKRAYACHYSKTGDFKESIKNLKLLEDYYNEDDSFDSIATKTVAIDIYIRASMFTESKRCIEEIEKSRINMERGRLSFYKNFLKSYLEDIPLGSCPESVKESSEYFAKWKVIDSLESGDEVQTRKNWDELVLLLPHLYSQKFSCINESESKCIFNRQLQKLLNQNNVETLNQDQVSGKKMKQLVSLLNDSKIPLTKEFLIESIWDVPYSPKYDNRLYKLIERLKSQYSVKISNNNSCYKIAS